ncbi:hypothetical protein [Bosea massiliensis]|uniref:Uncharacterized protein n=1 Tax=Bosea massiliensis TaxID=151419 RepID=A0ABW0NY43_9HYPH
MMAHRDRNTMDLFDDWLAAQPAPVAAPSPVTELEIQPSGERAPAPIDGALKTKATVAQRKIASSNPSDMAPASEIGCTEPIDFLTRRTKLGRWILHPGRSIEAYERGILREIGELAPAPILAFAPRPPPADPGDDDAPRRRAG